MKAKLKGMHCSDFDLNTYIPVDGTCFGFHLQASIGPEDSIGADIFSFTVCTPRWLELHRRSEEVLMMRHYIILFRYDIKAVEQRLTELIETQSGANWDELAMKISRWGHWEFEDYRP